MRLRTYLNNLLGSLHDIPDRSALRNSQALHHLVNRVTKGGERCQPSDRGNSLLASPRHRSRWDARWLGRLAAEEPHAIDGHAVGADGPKTVFGKAGVKALLFCILDRRKLGVEQKQGISTRVFNAQRKIGRPTRVVWLLVK